MEDKEMNNEVEKPEPTSEKKQAEPTVGKTYTQGELDKAVGKGIATVQQQLTLSKGRADQAEAELAEIRDKVSILEKELNEKDPGAIDFLEQEFAEAEKQRDLAQRESSLSEGTKELEKKKTKLGQREKILDMVEVAKAVMRKTGVPLEVIENCRTPEELEVKALQWKAQKLQNDLEEIEEREPPPTFDTGISTGGGFPMNPTNEQLESWSMERYAAWAKWRDEQSP